MKKIKTMFCFLPLIAVSLTSCGAGVTHEEKDYMIDIAYKSDFKVLQLSDIHLGQKDDLEKHYKFMDLTINEANPDFIMLTGDLFTFANRRTMNSFFDYLESKEIPWGVTWGNHDEQCDYSISYMTGELNKRAEKDGSYCKFIDLQDDDVYGYANYVINLKDGTNTKFQFYVIDSNRYYYGDYMGYDYIHEDQIAWYERMVNYSKTQNGGTIVPSVAFFHIPVPEFQTAWDLYQEGSSEVINNDTTGKLENREDVCCPKINTGFFDKVVELGSTKALITGHDHINDSDLTYKGIRLVYGTKGTDRIYSDGDMLGGTTITIHNDGTIDVGRIFHTYEEVK
mgnify:CR=1 FL=1